MSEQGERKWQNCLNEYDFDFKVPVTSRINNELRTICYTQIMNHLYGQMNLDKVAARYERELCHFPLLNSGRIDENQLRDHVRRLLHNDSPSTLIGEMFSLPRRQWHATYTQLNATMYGAPCDHSLVSPLIANFNATSPLPLKAAAQSDLAQLYRRYQTQERSKIPALPIKQRPKVDVTLMRKQHRLVHLGHAAICTNDDENYGPCRQSRHCARLKKLWSHLSVCHDDKCKVRHCFSSRFILGHYCKCKDSKCIVCEPARRQARKYQELFVPNSDRPLTNILTTTVSENDNLTKDSSTERDDTRFPEQSMNLGRGNSIYITNLKAFTSDDVSGDTVSTKRHSLSSVSALSPSHGERTLHLEPNDAMDVAFFLSSLKQHDGR